MSMVEQAGIRAAQAAKAQAYDNMMRQERDNILADQAYKQGLAKTSVQDLDVINALAAERDAYHKLLMQDQAPTYQPGDRLIDTPVDNYYNNPQVEEEIAVPPQSAFLRK